ncbi:MAG TPA: HEAT repeat domain-containing protein, partial [Anaeromyxobacter sp.]|nr:HEAT repeat domain-containing protein [Anaeromyxobacter sp.]
PDVNVRAAAAEALGKIGGTDAAGALLAALGSDDGTLKLAAIEALWALRVCPAAETVAALLADRTLRRPTYRVLGSSDDPQAFAFLAAGLGETARGAREAALSGVGMQRARRTEGELALLAEATRAAAGRDPGIADAAAEALLSEEPFVAMGALAVLGWIGGARHVRAMLRAAEDDRLRPLVEEALVGMPPDRELRGALAEALGEQGPLGRLTALSVLAQLGSPAALESVVREASDPDAYLQTEAIAALGRLGDARAVPPLAGLLGDDAPAVSGIAANALIRIGQLSAQGSALVLAAVRDRAGASPSAALYRVLGALGGGGDLALLEAGLRADPVAQRMAAAGAVAALAHRGVAVARDLPELVAALSDPAWSVRAAAARSYVEVARAARGGPGKAGGRGLGERVLAALKERLADPEPAVRAAAVEALGAIGDPELAAVVADLARGPDAQPLVVVAALRALVELGPPPADVVSRAAGHADPEVVKEAVAAAGRLTGPEGDRLLREAARSPRWDVRQAAARAMGERGDPALRAEAARLAAEDPDPLVARAFSDAEKALAAR